MKHIIMGAAIGLLTLGTAATAATFSIVGGVADSIPGGTSGDQATTPENNVLDALKLGTYNPVTKRYELDGYNSGISIAMNRTSKVRVELLGWEAGLYNSFTLDGKTVGKGLNGLPKTIFAAGDSLDSFWTGPLSSLDFTFTTKNSSGDFKGKVSNGDPNTIPGPNFFASFGPGKEAARTGNVLYLFYDDDKVLNDNHDDLVIRISAVPLPAGALLLISGLGVMALRRRKTS